MDNQYQNTQNLSTNVTPNQQGTGVPLPSSVFTPQIASNQQVITPPEAPVLPEASSLEQSPTSSSQSPVVPPVNNVSTPSNLENRPQPQPNLETPRTGISKKLLIIGGIALVIVLIIILLIGVISKKNAAKLQLPAESVSEQGITLGSNTTDTLNVLQLKGSHDKLIVNGDVISTGRLTMASGNYFGQFVTNNLSQNREYLLPDASGTICLDVNNCNFATAGGVVTSINGVAGAISVGSGLTLQGSTIVNSQTPTTVNGFNGNVLVQGTANQITVTNSAGNIILSAPQDIATSSSPTFQSITLNSTGTQNGNVICDISNNCGYAGGANAFIQNGNSFGTTATLGTNDNNNLVFETNNIDRVTVDTTGNVGISAASNGAKLYVPYQTGDAGGPNEAGSVSGASALLVVGSLNNTNNNLIAISGESYSGAGVQGASQTGSGVVGESTGTGGIAAGVLGVNFQSGGYGVVGLGGLFGGGNAIGVAGYSDNAAGVFGQSSAGISGLFQSTCTGLFGCVIGPSVLPTLVTKQYGSSTTDLFQAQDSANNARFAIGYNGHTGIGNGNNAAIDDCTMFSVLLTGATCSSVVDVQENVTDFSKDYTTGISNQIQLSPGDGSNVTSTIQGISNSVVTAADTANYNIVRGDVTSVIHQGSGTINFGEATHFAVNNSGAGSIAFAKGLQSDAVNYGSGSIGFATGINANAYNVTNGTIASASGLDASAGNLGSGSVTTSTGVTVTTGNQGSGSIGTNYGVQIQSAVNSGGGTLTDNYGLYIQDQSGVGSGLNYNLYSAGNGLNYFGGDVTAASQLAVGSVASITSNTIATFGELYTANSGSLYGTSTAITLNPASASSANATASFNNIAITGQNHTGFLTGNSSSVTNNGSGTLTYAFGNTGGAVNTSNGIISIAYGTTGAVVNSGAGSINFLGAGVVGQLQNTGLGTIASGTALFAASATNSGGGSITSNTGLYVQAQTAGVSDYGIQVEAADTQTLWLSSNADNTTASAGIAFGSSRDTNLYRGAATQLNTDGDLKVGSQLAVGSTASITSNTTLSIAETSTATSGNIYGSNNVLNYNPSGATTAVVYGGVNQITTPAGNAQNISAIVGGQSRVDHSGTGTISSAYGQYGYVGGGVGSGAITTAIGSIGQVDNFSSSTYTQTAGLYGIAKNGAGGSITTAYGVFGNVANGSTGSIGSAYNFSSLLQNVNAAGTITTAAGFYAQNPSNAGTITTNYGILVDPQTAGVSDYGVAIGAADTQTLWVSSNADNTTASAGIAFGSSRDLTLYRSAANTLMVTGHVLPSTTLTYDLGSDTNRWRDLYVGPATVHIGASGNEYGISYDTVGSALQFNSGLADRDIKISGTSQANLLYVDAGNNRVGVGTATPGYTLEVNGTFNAATSVAVGGVNVCTSSGCTVNPASGFVQGGNSFAATAVLGTSDANALTFITSGTEKARITTGGTLEVASTGAAGTVEKFRVNTPTTVDNSANAVIATSAATSTGLVVQGSASQSANLQEWQISTGAVRTFVDSDGRVAVGGGTTTPAIDSGGRLTVNSEGNSGFVVQYAVDGSDWFSVGKNGAGVVAFNQSGGSTLVATGSSFGARLNVGTLSAATKGLVIQGVASQSANLQEWQDSTGTVLGEIFANGQLAITSSGGGISNGTTNVYGARQSINTVANGTLGLVIRAAGPSQTADLQEWQASTGTSLAAVDASGRFVASTLGSADNATYLCRNSSNQIATCNTTGSGAAFIQGGNAFGAAAVLGTTDANDLQIKVNGTNTFTFNAGSGLSFQSNGYQFRGASSLNTASTPAYAFTGATNSGLYNPSTTVVGVAVAGSEVARFSGSALEVNSAGTPGTVEKFRVNTPTTTINTANVMIAANAASDIPLAIQGAPSQTGQYIVGYNSAGTSIFQVDTSGFFRGAGIVQLASANNSSVLTQTTGTAISRNVADANVALSVTQSNAGSTGAIQTWANSGGTVAQFTQAGVLEVNSTGTPGTVEKFRVNTPTTVDNSAVTILSTGATTSKGLVVQGVASQSANLQEWQNSSGTVLSSANSSGLFNFGTASNYIAGNAKTFTSGTALNATQSTGSSWLLNSVTRGTQLYSLETADYGSPASMSLSGDGYSGYTIPTLGSYGFIGSYSGARGSGSRDIVGSFNVAQSTATVSGDTVYGTRSSASFSSDQSGGSVNSAAYALYGSASTSTVSDVTSTRAATGVYGTATSTGSRTTGYGGYFTTGGSSTGTAIALQATAGTASTTGLVVKGASAQSANLQEWQDSTGAVLSGINSSGALTFGTTPAAAGNIRLPNATSISWRNAANTGDKSIKLSSANVTDALDMPGLIVVGGSDATAGRVYYFNSAVSNGRTAASGWDVQIAGTSRLAVNSNGAVGVTTNSTFTNGTVENFRVNTPTTVDNSANTILSASASTSKALVIQGAASQTANLQEWQDSTGATKLYVGKTGSFGAVTIGADAATNSSALVLKYAQTLTYLTAADSGNSSLLTIDNTVDPSWKNLIVKAKAAQTADLVQFQNSSGTNLLSITSAGALQGNNASGTNVAGSNITINGGQGTGTGNGGNIVFQYAPAGTSGSSANSLSTACTISGTNGSLSCPGAGGSSERFGSGAAASASSSVAIGNSASAGGTTGSVALGASASAGSTGAIAIGANASSGGSGNVAIGNGANASFGNNIALGQSASAAQNYSIAIGSSASAPQLYSIALGAGATTNDLNQLVVGSSTAAITKVFIGNGVTNASPQGFTLNATGGSGTNIAGASLTIAGGIGTGTGNGGSINLQVAKPGTTGSSANSLATVASFSGVDGSAILQNSANSVTALQLKNAGGTTTVLDVDTSNNRVGINTAAPGAAVEISQTNQGANYGLRITQAGLNVNLYHGSGNTFFLDAPTNFQLGNPSTGTAYGKVVAGRYLTLQTWNGSNLGGIKLNNNGTDVLTMQGSDNNLYLGNGVTSATPTGQKLIATGGSGTNIAGASLTLAGGIGTGTGNGGNINLQVAKPGTTGSSANSLATVASLSGVDGSAIFQNSANSTSAFIIKDSGGTNNVLGIDTTNDRVGIGTGTGAPAYTLDVLSAGADATTVAQFKNAGATSCTVQPGGTGFACSSDARLKTNVATVINPEDTIKALRGVTFNWITDPNGQTHAGFIAQELEQVIPSAVSTDSNGYKVANYSEVIPYLVGTAQYQDTQITGLQQGQVNLQQTQTASNTSLASLDSRVNTLEQKVSALEANQGNANFASLNVSGPATIQTLTVTGSATIANLTVTGNATIAGNLTIQGHVLGNSDTRGTITVPAGQTQYKFTFVKPYTSGSKPVVTLTPSNTFAPSYRVDSTDTDFTIYFETPATTDVIMNYQVQQ